MNIIDALDNGDTIRLAPDPSQSPSSATLAGASSEHEAIPSIHNKMLSERHRVSETPLFVASGSDSTRSESYIPPESFIPPNASFAVVVPPISRRWEYRTYDNDPRVRAVLKEIRDAGELAYMVRTKDDRKIKVSFHHLLQLPGGSRALDRFGEQLSTQSDRSKTSSPDANMVSSRPRQSMRVRRPSRLRQLGFVDSSQIDLSNEDDLNTERGRNINPAQRRGLLSLRRGSRTRASRAKLVYSSSDQTDSDEPKHRKAKKAPITRPSRFTATAALNYEERPPEEDIDSSSSADSYAKLGKRKRAFYRDAEVTRRSERSGRVLGSMRERGEDDIPETNTRTSSNGGVKIISTKETFKTLPRSDEFRLRHCQNCDVCNDFGDSGEKGQLIFCQGCTVSYHQSCLGPRNGREHLVTKIGHKDFVLQCRRCVGYAKKKEATAPRQGECQQCHLSGSSSEPFRDRKSAREEQKEREANHGEDPVTYIPAERLNRVDNVLFRCMSCYQAFHMHHLQSKIERILPVATDDTQIGNDRFTEYCKTWTCHDCSTAPEQIDALVAWRPVNIESYIPGQTIEQLDEDDKEYLVKWKRMSYYRVTWKRGSWVWGMTHRSMRNAFARKNNGLNLPKMTIEDAVPEDYLRVDIVFEVKYNNVVTVRTEDIDLARVKEVERARVKFKGLGYEDVIWEDPPPPEDGERWADWKMAYEDWVYGHYVRLPAQGTLKPHLTRIRSLDFESKVMMKEQPKTLIGGELMKYQMEGMNWLLYQWHSKHNAILADEMGLGKTIQIIGFLTTLQQEHRCWPFLVVVPNSTCANWRREIKRWAPSLRVVTYFGSAEARRLAHQFELFPGVNKELACHVVVTSYDAAQDHYVQTVLRRIPWAGLIVDEGQRLKNDNNILYHALTALKIPFKVLLTGTPLQNNQRELFNLLQFLDNSIKAQKLEDRFATLTKENVAELHELLRPFFLRRTKAQVLDFLPPMAQIIVPVTASALQKELYKSILAKNPELLRSIIGGDKKASVVKGLRNLLMQLRKCLCHPFVYSMEIEERSSNTVVSHRRLVEASSKLQLLEIMLPKLKERGHRVLIFSQFLDMMTIIEDFLDGLGLLHQRLDGTMGSLAKQKCIDEFNAPDSPLFALILSTRAGGVGINLATADTVIILDPDFNPHQDIQAISRAHRIGQKKKVLIFQLMTRGTAEEKIMQIGKKKMALDHVLIEQMDAEDIDSNDLESVLRFGAEAIFKDDSTQDIQYDSLSVDKLLDRSQVEDTKTGKDATAESQFSFARVWANETGNLEEGLGTVSDQDAPKDTKFWDKILNDRRLQAEKERALRTEDLGRGKRQRQTIDYTRQAINRTDGRDSPDRELHLSDSDTDFQAREDSEADDSAGEAGTVDPAELHEPGERPSRSAFVSRSPLQPTAGNFRRAHVTAPSESVRPETGSACIACSNVYGMHDPGFCPLKLAGVEYCNLCGLAHYGMGVICPHFNSETQINIMMQNLASSTEPRELVQQAMNTLRSVKAQLVHQKSKAAAAKYLAAAQVQRTQTQVQGVQPENGPQPSVFNGLTKNSNQHPPYENGANGGRPAVQSFNDFSEPATDWGSTTYLSAPALVHGMPGLVNGAPRSFVPSNGTAPPAPI